VANVLGLLPITPGGVGVVEGVLVPPLVAAGVPAHLALVTPQPASANRDDELKNTGEERPGALTVLHPDEKTPPRPSGAGAG
jgi:hypothetical protein